MNIEQFDALLEQLKAERETKNKQEAWLLANKDLLLSVGGYVTTYSGIEFRKADRDDVSAIIKAVKSDDENPWKKSYYGETVDYTRKNGGLTIRIDGAAPPPSCKVVSEQVLVPSVFIAEHYETRTRIVCKEDTQPSDSPSSSENLDESPTSPAPVPAYADTASVPSPMEDSSALLGVPLPSPDPHPAISPPDCADFDSGEQTRYGGDEV